MTTIVEVTAGFETTRKPGGHRVLTFGAYECARRTDEPAGYHGFSSSNRTRRKSTRTYRRLGQGAGYLPSWQWPHAATQVLGQAAFDAGRIVGLVYESTKSATSGKGILVFTGRLAAAGSYVELDNEAGGKLQRRIP
jgi:hypothetical protein